MRSYPIFRRILFVLSFSLNALLVVAGAPIFHYKISIPRAATPIYEVELSCKWNRDTIHFKMPRWMPGYYQHIDYAASVINMRATDDKGKNIAFEKLNDNTWVIKGVKNKPFFLRYSVNTTKKFVANSYVDSAHAYLAPANTFLYIDGQLNNPVTVSFSFNPSWKIATGLDPVKGFANKFTAPDFDILYDCPILIGELEQLPSFKVKGVEHRFIGYKMGDFDRGLFMSNVQKVVQAAVDIIGYIPFKQYTFIAIGPGRGGIEHLNNTTISFDGNGLNKPGAMNRMLNFIAHEYFHHYNVKRIRPFELGPFNYDKGNRTNLLWVSEGLTVYYEYLVVKRAGLSDAQMLLANFSNNLDAVENNPGRHHQSLQQASYSTWSDGPFGTQGKEPGKSISYYVKGPVIGLLLDFEIRNATKNKSSLDDVMRLLYQKYYLEMQRGFTEAEFQSACEEVAGIGLSGFFEYVYTTKAPDHAKYLAYGGLKIDTVLVETKEKTIKNKLEINKMENPDALQAAILRSWMGE